MMRPGSSTHLECRYFLSFSVDLDCLVVVSKLTFPPEGLGGAKPPRDGDLRFTAHIYCHGQPLHLVPVSTSSCPHRVVGGLPPSPEGGGGGNSGGSPPPPGLIAGAAGNGGSSAGLALVWDEVVNFPVKVSDLSRNARLVLTAWLPAGGAFGGTSVPLFDNTGVLRTGRQKLLFYCGGGGGDGGLRCATPGEASPVDLEREDYGFRVMKAKEAFEVGSCARVPWLDAHLMRLADAQACDPSLARGLRPGPPPPPPPQQRGQTKQGGGGGLQPPTPVPLSWGAGDLAVASCVWLEVELPTFAYPVIHEERKYQMRQQEQYPTPRLLNFRARAAAAAKARANTTKASGSHGNSTATTAAATAAELAVLNSLDPSFGAGSGAGAGGGGGGGLFVPPLVFDCENDALVANPSEEMRRRLMHDQLRGAMDPDLKPDTSQRKAIDKILSNPSDSLSNSEKDLLWMFGYTLTSRPNAVVKFVLAVYWDNDTEVETATRLLRAWQQPDIAYALKLLSEEPSFQHKVVRSFAVRRLEQASDGELELFLLQLVAALRYEPSTQSDIEQQQQQQQQQQGSSSGSGSSSSKAPSPSDSGGDSGSEDLSPLAQFLVSRACACEAPYSLANFLYWFLKVESEADEFYGGMYRDVFNLFLKALPDNISQVLHDQHAYVERVSECQLKAFNTKGNRDVKQKEMGRLLVGLGDELNGKKSAPSPVNPNIVLMGVEPNVKMYQSALYPAAVTFAIQPNPEVKLHYEASIEQAKKELREASSSSGGESTGEQQGQQRGGRRLSGAALAAGMAAQMAAQGKLARLEKEYAVHTKLRMMIKNGDDVRQDQLILQMFRVMDHCLKRVGLDLKLTIYGCLATSPKSGMMEFVCAEDGSPSTAIELLEVSIAEYLRQHQPSASSSSQGGDDPGGGGSGGSSVSSGSSSAGGSGSSSSGSSGGSSSGVSSSSSSGGGGSDGGSGQTPTAAGTSQGGISREALDTFASSMAGYAVLTYLLGVGDRHLGNLLMLPNGRMCHIDFGWVFGDDPKKKFVNPPPFRITKAMVDCMGGVKGEVFQQVFCRKAFGAYKELRHNAVLVMSLLRLMKDSGIEALLENREAKLQNVEDRFRLDLNDEEAEAFMAGIIQESMTHVGIQVLEGFHNLARALR